MDEYFTRYEGCLSSHDHCRAEDDWLAALAARIRTFTWPCPLAATAMAGFELH